ncbi:MAG: cyclic pyranopterin monophosphate synthase MoaC [Candidatus Eremiobacteraeota bacterium]|nr:cyclic pyranopterin monophosphate synthase MoaC [Candidatus Eremiobacteraeota bacterium]
MVDVGEKTSTLRRATAQAVVRMAPAALALLERKALVKGDAFVAAQMAGTLAAKRTSDLIPLCHSISLSQVEVRCAVGGADRVTITCRVSCKGPTGVEMDALMGAAVAALTIYDMCKASDRAMVIEEIRLERKSGGRSGTYARSKR